MLFTFASHRLVNIAVSGSLAAQQRQYAHSHRRHLANLAPHASHSCSIKQADSACPPARLTSQQYFAFSSPATFIAHTPAPFILLRFCPIPCAARFIAQRVIHFCPSHFPPYLRFPKNARTVRLAALTISLSHICPFSCAPSKAIRQRPLPHTLPFTSCTPPRPSPRAYHTMRYRSSRFSPQRQYLRATL